MTSGARWLVDAATSFQVSPLCRECWALAVSRHLPQALLPRHGAPRPLRRLSRPQLNKRSTSAGWWNIQCSTRRRWRAGNMQASASCGSIRTPRRSRARPRRWPRCGSPMRARWCAWLAATTVTAVVLGGVSLALAAALCAFVTEPEETQAVSVFSSSVNRVPSTRLNNGPSAAAFRLAASSETFVRRFVSDQT
jgi:hypothetical protein